MVNDRVYSPDITHYDLEGMSGIVNTISSIMVAPIRISMRVMHNIFVLPANLQAVYAESLLFICFVMCIFGVADLVLFGKWVLLVSQLPLIIYAMRLKSQAKKSVNVFERKQEVEINIDEVESLCNTVYDELDTVLK